jgi:hypothetical protein
VAVYAIRVIGHVDAHWSVWFDGLTISNASPGEAMISGEIADQAALHGALNKIRNLNLALISVIKVDSAAVEPIPQTDQSPPSARSWHAAGREPDVSPQALSTRRILRACLSDQLVSHTFGLFFACGPLIRRCAAWESRLARADSQQWRCEPAIGIAGRCSLRR